MGLALLTQYTLTAATNIALQTGLSPAVDTTATLALEQSNASGALSDYIMLSREASLDDYRQTIGRATTLLDELKDTLSGDAELTDLVAAARAAQRGMGQDRRRAVHHPHGGRQAHARDQGDELTRTRGRPTTR